MRFAHSSPSPIKDDGASQTSGGYFCGQIGTMYFMEGCWDEVCSWIHALHHGRSK